MLFGLVSLLSIVVMIIVYRSGSGMWDRQDLRVNGLKKFSFGIYLLVEKIFKPNKKSVDVVKFMLLNVYDQLTARFVDVELINSFLQNYANNIIVEGCIDSKKDRYFLIKRKYDDKSKTMIIKMSDIKAFEYDGKIRDQLADKSGECLPKESRGAGIRRVK